MSRKPDPRLDATAGFDVFAVAALAVHLALALSLRATAWPEVTTPGYLWSRGMLMYRDIKLQHAPGTTGTLALGFLAFGPSTWFIRAYAAIWPLLAHVSILRETRRFAVPIRALASGFFLAVLFVSEGHAVWPTVVMTALAIPIASSLARGRMVRAGLLIGLAILFKQTAAYLLLLATLALAVRGRTRDSMRLFFVGCAPYLVTLLVFTALGAGVDMLRWTIEVPFTVRPELVRFDPGCWTGVNRVFAFLPLAAEAWLERPGEYKVAAPWLLLVAVGLAMITYPRFALVNVVGCVPCLAIGAARIMNRVRPRLLAPAAIAFVLTLTLFRGAVHLAGSEFDGRVVFWNDDPAFNALIERLRTLPPETRVYSELWGNVHPRAERLPPGSIYQHHWFDWFFAVDRTGERMREANLRPGTAIVGYRDALPGAEVVGPYGILRR